MRLRTLTFITGVLILAVLIPAESAAAAEVIKDGSFESTPADQDNPNWDEGGIAAPICDVEGCGDNNGTAGPHTGNNWAFFGGVPFADFQSVAQDVLIPSAPATLTFWLWLGRSNGGALDAFRVFIDNTELFELLENGTGYGKYTQVTIDMSPYAGGDAKNLSFEFDGFGGVPETSFSVDDISLMAGAAAAKTVTLSGRRSVPKGKKVKLTAKVEPCAGHEGDTIELFRGKQKLKVVASDGSCTAVFKVKVKKAAGYRAVSPQQDADHAEGTSKTLKIRVKKPRR